MIFMCIAILHLKPYNPTMIFIKRSLVLSYISCFFLTFFISCTQDSDQEPLVVKDNLVCLQFSTNILEAYTKRELNSIEQKVNGNDSSKKEHWLIWQMKAQKIEELTTRFKVIRDSCLNKTTGIFNTEDCLLSAFEIYRTTILQVDPQIAKALFPVCSGLLIEKEFAKVNAIRYQTDLLSLSDYFIAIIKNRAIAFCNSSL